MAATLARAFASDPFYSFLAGDAPERNQRMRDGWGGILRFGSARLAETYTTDDHAGVALWIPPGHGGASVIDSLRMTPAIARLAGWRRLRKVTNASRRAGGAPSPSRAASALLSVGARRRARSPGRGDRHGTHATGARPVPARRHPGLSRDGPARNVLLYESSGFEVVEELTLPDTDVHGWLMLRPAAGYPSRPIDSSSARA